MSESKKSIQELSALLKLEKDSDYEQFKNLIQGLPLAERKEQGYTWYPLNVIKTGYTIGERAFVVVERNIDIETSHKFRSGKTVNFFTQQNDAFQPERSGVINYVEKNKMKIVLNSKDVPEWTNKGMVGVDLMFDERTYLEMEKALKTVAKASKDRLAELREILIGKNAPTFEDLKFQVEIPQLNEAQNKAVRNITAARDVAIVHGPPGTGKTTTLTYAIKLLAQQEGTVLVTAPSNAAVDLLTAKLAEIDLKVVRIGNISRVDDKIVQHTLEAQISNHPESKNIKKVKIQAAEARKKARKFKRSFGAKQRAERNQLHTEARELAAWANQLENRLIDQILGGANVICATLVGSNNRILEKLKFRTVVIDEAAQALEPATWIPICKASKVVLTGDPFQLPPTVKSNEAQRGGLNITLIEKCIQKWPDVNLLNIQYRMNKLIMGFSNQQFYDNRLIADDSVADHLLENDTTPVLFIDTAGCGFDEKVNEEYKSKFNPDEFNILREHFYQLIAKFDLAEMPSIAIISPYRQQVIHMKSIIEEDEKMQELPITINTIDAFQGQERDVVYISLVRSNSKTEIGFLSDYRRMNVAMTRARKKLIVVGDSATIGGHDFYSAFIDYCEKKGQYESAWAFMQ